MQFKPQAVPVDSDHKTAVKSEENRCRRPSGGGKWRKGGFDKQIKFIQ